MKIINAAVRIVLLVSILWVGGVFAEDSKIITSGGVTQVEFLK